MQDHHMLMKLVIITNLAKVWPKQTLIYVQYFYKNG